MTNWWYGYGTYRRLILDDAIHPMDDGYNPNPGIRGKTNESNNNKLLIQFYARQSKPPCIA